MQVPPASPTSDAAAILNELVARELPRPEALAAWRALLVAQATLIRQLDVELQDATGLSLADFDVLAPLALAGGCLRMTQLADLALISRSGMTRRVARLVDDGLVRRESVEDDGRGVVVSLTDTGLARLVETVPEHCRGIARHFLDKLSEEELANVERAMTKVSVACSFG